MCRRRLRGWIVWLWGIGIKRQRTEDGRRLSAVIMWVVVSVARFNILLFLTSRIIEASSQISYELFGRLACLWPHCRSTN